MEINRVYEILNSKKKVDIEYKSQPVWIQYIESSDKARVGFIENFDEKVVDVKELTEK